MYALELYAISSRTANGAVAPWSATGVADRSTMQKPAGPHLVLLLFVILKDSRVRSQSPETVRCRKLPHQLAPRQLARASVGRARNPGCAVLGWPSGHAHQVISSSTRDTMEVRRGTGSTKGLGTCLAIAAAGVRWQPGHGINAVRHASKLLRAAAE